MPSVDPTPPLYIERITVEEGFLDGLDLGFRPGLNVLIGPRGVGKTSVIELLRFCFGVPALTERFAQASRDHARSVLSDGRVVVTYALDVDRLTIARRSRDEDPEGEPIPIGSSPIVLSQNEIEAVGLDARGRLRIVDGFRRDSAAELRRERAALSNIESLSREIRDLEADLTRLEHEASELPDARTALSAANDEHAAQQHTLQQALPELAALDDLSKTLAADAVRASSLDRSIAAMSQWSGAVSQVLRTTPVLEAPDDDPSTRQLRNRVQAAQTKIEAARDEIDQALQFLEAQLTAARDASRVNEDRARELRRLAESLQEGAGAVARRRAALQERVAQLEALQGLAVERRERVASRRRLRDEAIDELEGVRTRRFEERQVVARDLSRDLSPQIEIDVRRSGLSGEYAKAIAETLRGSGLHYSQIAPLLAERVPPYELVKLAEDRNHKLVARLLDIPDDRAQRVLDRIGESDAAPILQANVEDSAAFRLLVGPEFRDTTMLSTGQRCTAVLPVLLHHANRPLIMDQPEDHLDTAFIVETLVKAIRQRPPTSQLIVSTHNPNIPVLGEASQVTVLDSDGRRGYASHTGDLDSDETVHAITSIMEGGREAFERRASFYRSHPT